MVHEKNLSFPKKLQNSEFNCCFMLSVAFYVVFYRVMNACHDDTIVIVRGSIFIAMEKVIKDDVFCVKYGCQFAPPKTSNHKAFRDLMIE